MAGAVLCFVEEMSLPQSAYAKLKQWIDAPKITIREMRCNAYSLPNFAHFIQTANSRDACPLEPGDERIVVIPVEPLETLIPWTSEMAPALIREAPNFLATLQSDTFPPDDGRLFLPVLETPDKIEMMKGMEQRREEHDPAVVTVVAGAIKSLIKRQEFFHGHAGDLLKAIGKGPWKSSASTLAQYVKSAASVLKPGINIYISPRIKGQRTITIGPYWLVDDQQSMDSFSADEEYAEAF
jgi:hypothetical protein